MLDKLGNLMKKHWLALVLVAAVLILSTAVNDNFGRGPILPFAEEGRMAKADAMVPELSYVPGPSGGGIAPDEYGSRRIVPGYYGDDFAPDIEKREIERDAYVSLEIKRGKFDDAQKQLKELITATDSLLLYENVNAYDAASYGSYNIKVKAERYEFFITQVRELGRVLSLTDNARDVTSQIASMQEQIGQSRAELNRLKDLLKETAKEPERIKLQQQISDQERYLNSLQDQLKNQKDRVEYFTVNVNLQEAPSGYQGVELINFSDLLRKLVLSINALLRWLFGVLPWAILAAIVWFIVKVVQRRA